MKTLLVTLSLALAAGATTVQAQSAVGPGAVVGAIAGGLIGGHNNDRWAEGAVIGGVAGAIIGAAVSTPSRPAYAYQDTTVYAQPAPVVTAPPPTVIYTQPAPQVVYAQPAPTVVYAPPPPTVVYVGPGPRYCPPPPPVSYHFRYYSGPRYGGHGHHGGHRW
ncbi:hypothetical protein [Opitutus sp. ER46]|uniref:hypothetical protein n=1 Tax=Opitutus sp. ER46 TaxID=2161864 RepID=UPI000D301598|nr:hypothetical protein [Opitutus sp. ER46]PTX95673.1 hypothetical protein DB354_09675 [Opitutus sp. ER46]